MTTNNSVNSPLSGTTGTGNFVGANTPTLITPVLGAATATSINFGGSSLGNYISETSWTPVFTFGTPGNLSVAYATQVGVYQRVGNMVMLQWYLEFTPTWTTSSGIVTITGLPFAAVSTSFSYVIGSVFLGSQALYPTGCTAPTCWIVPGSSAITMLAQGAGNSNNFSTTQYATGVAASIVGSVTYFV